MPSDAPDSRRRRTNARVVHLVSDHDTPPTLKVDGTDALTANTTVDAEDDPEVMGCIGADLLAGTAEIRTTAPRTALRVRAVVDRLLAARADLDPADHDR